MSKPSQFLSGLSGSGVYPDPWAGLVKDPLLILSFVFFNRSNKLYIDQGMYKLRINYPTRILSVGIRSFGCEPTPKTGDLLLLLLLFLTRFKLKAFDYFTSTAKL